MQAQAPGQVGVPYQSVAVVQQQTPAATQTEVTPYAKTSSKVLGWLQIVLGLAGAILEIIYLTVYSGNNRCVVSIGAGIWTGLLYVLSGMFGPLAGERATQCRVVSFMVFSIISCVAAFIGGIIALVLVIAIETDQLVSAYAGYDPDSSTTMYSTESCYVNASKTPQTILIFIHTAQFFIALASSIICCRGACCGGRSTQGTVISTTTNTTTAIPQPTYYYPMQQPTNQPSYPVQGTGGYYFPAPSQPTGYAQGYPAQPYPPTQYPPMLQQQQLQQQGSGYPQPLPDQTTTITPSAPPPGNDTYTAGQNKAPPAYDDIAKKQ